MFHPKLLCCGCCFFTAIINFGNSEESVSETEKVEDMENAKEKKVEGELKKKKSHISRLHVKPDWGGLWRNDTYIQNTHLLIWQDLLISTIINTCTRRNYFSCEPGYLSKVIKHVYSLWSSHQKSEIKFTVCNLN